MMPNTNTNTGAYGHVGVSGAGAAAMTNPEHRRGSGCTRVAMLATMLMRQRPNYRGQDWPTILAPRLHTAIGARRC